MLNASMDIGELRARASDERRLSAGGRPAALTLTLGSDGAELPVATELAALLPRVPVAGVRLAEPADFSSLPGHAIVRIIALIRECSSIGAQVTWSLILGAEQLDLIPWLDHLPAPDKITVSTKETPAAGKWRSSSNFGIFYFRKGTKFLTVDDRRPESNRRIIVDDPAKVDVFVQGLAGCAWTEFSQKPRYAAAARDLVNEGLVMRVGDHCVTLPVHMRSWPMGVALCTGLRRVV
jgi:hypothetical protein